MATEPTRSPLRNVTQWPFGGALFSHEIAEHGDDCSCPPDVVAYSRRTRRIGRGRRRVHGAWRWLTQWPRRVAGAVTDRVYWTLGR